MTFPRSRVSSEALLGVDEALQRVLGAVDPLPPVRVNLVEALGLVAVHDVIATTNLPPFTNAAMDGYALRSADTDDPASRTLRVVETIAAGGVARRKLTARQAARIMTGAALPDGADAVVRFEETDECERSTAESIAVSRQVRAGENVRTEGEDLRAGAVALSAGSLLDPAQIGLLAALGFPQVWVHRRPVVGILSTGDEVIEPGLPLAPGQIHDANTSIVHALVRQAGGVPQLLGIARDASSDVIERLERGPRPDLFVTSGGVSVGDYDIVKEVLRTHGAIEIWQVCMKPGRPLAFGQIGGTPLLGLPGNPVAALVSFLQFGRPLVRRMLGRSDLTMSAVRATLIEPIDNPGGRRHFVRGIVDFVAPNVTVRPVVGRGAGILSAMAGANCLIVVPETERSLQAGSEVTVQLFDRADIGA